VADQATKNGMQAGEVLASVHIFPRQAPHARFASAFPSGNLFFFFLFFFSKATSFFVPSSILETGRFFAASGVQLAQHDCGLFHFRRAVFSPELKTKVGRTLDKTTPVRES
jgi:hypothetical protein